MSTIFLDMDGVCCDFASAAQEAHGFKPYDCETWEMTKEMGISTDQFYDKINSLGEDFWRGLKEYPWFNTMYRDLHRAFERVVFCTTPMFSAWSASGKIKWLQDRFGSDFRDYIITYNKPMLARCGAVLIDDRYETVVEYTKAGGDAVLFPQPYNRMLPRPQAHTPQCDLAETIVLSHVRPHLTKR